jgi:nicotinamidase-related amidase
MPAGIPGTGVSIMTESGSLSREVALVPGQSAVLFIDVQNYCCRREGGEFAGIGEEEMAAKYGYYFDRLENVAVPNMQRVQAAFREAGMELLYTTIESLTQDGRDRSLDYKVTGFNVPKGHWDGRVIDEIAPGDNEIWLPKGSSSVFVSTHIDYILRNLGIRQLVLCGFVTDQCVESAVRDACDIGYLVTLVTDACGTYSQERHDNSLAAIRGYCRQRTTDELLGEIAGLGQKRAS